MLSQNKVRHLTDTDLGFRSPTSDEIDLTQEDIEAVSEKLSFPEDDIEMWVQSLQRKKQIIFYGPPGTGKTFAGKELADRITDGTDGFWDTIQFHQSYEYEDFIQGLRPKTDSSGNPTYELQAGTFLEFCEKARENQSPCVLILDEINRTDLSSVFGELMYLLEYRNDDLQLAQHTKEDEGFSIPDNVYLLGTMNTADRSIALVDFALRRRFAFIPLYPNYDVLRNHYEDTAIDVTELIEMIEIINEEINDRQYSLGFTYFLDVDLENELENIWELEIEPYLEEYFVDDPETVNDYRWESIEDDISL
jgi:5-methylcytosine-specific restriction protein B